MKVIIARVHSTTHEVEFSQMRPRSIRLLQKYCKTELAEREDLAAVGAAITFPKTVTAMNVCIFTRRM